MNITISEVGAEKLGSYGDVPIRFQVESVFRVDEVDDGLGGLTLTEERVAKPYIKDYDQFEGERASDWGKRFDVSNWGFFLASDGNRPVAGAAVAFKTEGVNMLEGRTDLAALWDIRVHPNYRWQGIGSRLFQHASDWARDRGCKQLKVETQNVNVGASKFYVSQGCHLGDINRYGYLDCKEARREVMLLWYLEL